MKDIVEKTLERFGLWEKGDPILVACSGGPDSLSLLHLLWENRAEWGIHVTAAHLNHCLRGEESDGDAQSVQNFCRERGIPCVTDRVPEGSWREGQVGMETQARVLRYAFLNTVADRVGAHRIATGHNADDNVETFFLSLLRGAGLEGMVGIPPKRDRIIRPLIGVWRSQIEDYSRAFGLAPRTDHTNFEFGTLRNWMRGHLIPELEEKSSDFKKRILRTIDVLREELDLREALVGKAKRAFVLATGPTRAVLKKEGLADLPRAVLRRIIRDVTQFLGASGQDIGFEETEEILHGVLNGVSFSKDLPGKLRVEKGPETIAFLKKG